MNFKAIIIEDDPLAAEILKQHCKTSGNITVMEVFDNPVKALAYIENNTADLIFVDIHLPLLSGMDFLKIAEHLPFTIITTVDTNFALQAFEFNVVDYLIKPIKYLRFSKAIDKVSNLISTLENESTAEDIFINVDRSIVKLSTDDILFVQANGDYAKIHTNDKNYIVHSTMKGMMEKLPNNLFYKVHRSYIVNMKKVEDFSDNYLTVSNAQVPVSKSKKNLVIDYFKS